MKEGTLGCIIAAIAAAVLISCLCLVIAGVAVYVFGVNLDWNEINYSYEYEFGNTTSTPVVVRPTQKAEATKLSERIQTPVETPGVEELLEKTPVTTGEPTLKPVEDRVETFVHTETLKTLDEAIVPINDLLDLARRLEGKENIPTTLEPPAVPYQVGSQDTFWVTNVDSNENFQVDATLRYVTDHLYFWIEDGVRYDERELRDLAETFEEEIYPTNREFFGSEWSPGVDGDPHLYILYAGGLGYSLAGYYSSADEFSPLAHEYSNAHEMFLLNSDNIGLGEEFTYGVLAHEFQHMIHWYRDRNETSWLDEGFSELAAFLNGYDVGGFDYLYVANPDIQLNDWPNDSSATSPHYGASFLFVTYFLDRLGEDATKALVADDENGMDSVDNVLRQLQVVDPMTGEPISGDDIFFDWVIASYLQDSQVGDGRYTYHNYAGAPQSSNTETVSTCPTGAETRDVNQYGVDYVRIVCPGEYTLHFEGSTEIDLLPEDPFSGEYAFWSNKGDESDMTLTRTFDFTNVSGPLTLSYWTWYDLEEDYDYLYLEASLDGESWQILNTPSGTADDPSGNSYGWGYNGLSGEGPQWIQEEVDLSQFAGEAVQIRFEYVTDAAVNGEGFLLDDIAVPEVDYLSDFEADDGGWEAEGFVRIQNVLPQTFRVAVITNGQETEIRQVDLGPDIAAEIPISIGEDVDDVILVVSGTTRYTRQSAPYRFWVD